MTLKDEQYSARVDRVDVSLEFFNTGVYRLKTNELVREGEYIRTQGYEDDVDAHLYILNPEHNGGEEMYYVRFSSEPNSIYILDSAQEVIKGSRLQRVE